MSSAVEMMDDARSRVAFMVERRERVTGSRMVACQDIASLIGRSESWVRKLIGRTLDTKRPDAVALQNIRAVYSRVCGVVEASAERLEDEAASRNRPVVPSLDRGSKSAPVTDEELEIPEFLRRAAK